MSPLSARLSLGFACAGHAFMHVLSALYLTIVLGLERDWAMSYDELIRLWTIGSLMIGLGAPLSGWLGDRWSDAKMMVVFFLLTGAGAIAAGLADGATALTIGLAVLGLGSSIYHPVGMSWVIKNAANRGRALGVMGIFGSIGIACAALIAGGLTELINWRAAFIVPGAVCMLTGVALFACVATGLVTDRQRDAKPQPGTNRSDAVRAFIVLSVTMVCAGLIFQSTVTAMPKWFGERMTGLVGEGTLGVGGLVTLVYLFASGSQFIGGMLSDRYPLKHVYVMCLAIQIPLLLIASSFAGLPLLVVAGLVVFTQSLQIPAENLLLARHTPDKHRGLAFGAKFVLSFGVAPLGVQLVALTYGWSVDFWWLFLILGGFATVAVLAATLLPRESAPVPRRAAATPDPLTAPAIGAE
ncbi:MFS transporter [Skermanella stibiiresistens SB22]|uniref:MFS transporter n=1 Tax=Skermanella stibiiresistens SB22 TaxID=1385369 RepID=W9GZN8_9PROT|nr:MFS transporter [Skermanella stibiiresistens]EWY39264.1 MFS transporter [Skermanella stibiiresistens SB22]